MTNNILPSKCDRKDCSYPATDGTFCDVHAEEQRLVVLMEGVLLKNAGRVGDFTPLSPVVYIARCPECGLHGERSSCFECGGEVEQVAMVTVEEVEALREELAAATKTIWFIDRMTRDGVGPDTSAIQVLSTIAAFIDKRHGEALTRVAESTEEEQ